MGFLLGLPLKLLALVFGLLRVLIPVLLLILVIRWLWRKYGGHRRSESAKKDEPHFKGPEIRENPGFRPRRKSLHHRSRHCAAPRGG